jgi:ketosteroid isomerase-like protein
MNLNTRRTTALTALAALSLSLAACSGGGEKPAAPAAEPAPTAQQESAPMRDETAAELAQLLNDFDPVAFGALLTDNARLLPPNIPAIEGRDAIVEHYKGVVAIQLKYEATPIRVATFGNVAISEGTYRVKNLRKDAYVEDGKYMAVWVNQDGQWKVARFMVNTDYQLARVSVTVEPQDAAGADGAKP